MWGIGCRRRRAARRRLPAARLTPLPACPNPLGPLQLPGLHAPGPSAGFQPFRPPTAAQAAEAALYGELPPAVAGLGPSGGFGQADVDAFLRGLPAQQAGPHAGPDFSEFETIYRQQPPGAAGLQGLPMPALAQQGRAAAAPMLQVRCAARSVSVSAAGTGTVEL